jgi:hypothetical protein
LEGALEASLLWLAHVVLFFEFRMSFHNVNYLNRFWGS